MKHFLFFLFLTLFFLPGLSAQTVLRGKITDEAGAPLVGAAVKLYKDTLVHKGAVTDLNGEFRLALEPGQYTLEVRYTGYALLKTDRVAVLAGKTNTFLGVLTAGNVLNEVVITDYKVPTIEKDVCFAVSGKADRAKSEKKRNAVAPTPATPADEDAILKKIEAGNIVSMPDEGAYRGNRFRLDLAERYEEPLHLDDADAYPVSSNPGTPRAGQLTAGEWNDLHNWNKHWLDLLADGEIDPYMAQYGFYPKNRFTVWLHNTNGFPLADAPLQLKNDIGDLLWEARTDNIGRAELWNGIVDKPAMGAVYAFYQGKRLGKLLPAQEGMNHFVVDGRCDQTAKVADILWVVDATGSMGDELAFLKTELMDVIGRVQYANPDLGIRTGSVFYRDEGDAYVCKNSPLSTDLGQTVAYIAQQQAAGGGDYPEAVHTALEEAILKQPWRSEAVARICFLLLDASPHQEPAVLESIRRSIRLAAQKGIRIVPVSGSGIQKDTEFLMKFFGLATNGSYVFLTDHSGIGGKHLEPTTDEYKVEMLNDLLVRLITEYTSVPDCAGKTALRLTDPQHTETADSTPEAFIFPNPVREAFFLELPLSAQKVTLYNAEGQAVRNLTNLASGQHRIDVQGLPAGFYTLRIWCGERVQSAKVIVVQV
ncbi:MAG: carboxypeptidase regulatory-like domain-containing protein [Saprospiraceae bacterium]|nr:carboxypeptidase regulatory-like domain-containing protein [Saprospiraceae bacterium]